MRLSRGFRPLVALRPALPATGLPILTPAGLPPAEHISLYWTHNRTCNFHCIRLTPSLTPLARRGGSLLSSRRLAEAPLVRPREEQPTRPRPEIGGSPLKTR